MKACPTGGLQPALTEAGPEGIWTPMLVPKIGYCEYYCSLCTQVCPTGAIKKLTIEEKNKVKIGTAWVNKSRCIPYVLGKPCIVCEEHCPISPKAIKLVEVETKLPDGTVAVQKAPGHRPRALHRLRHLREQVPGHGRPGHLRHERRGNAVGDEPPAPGYFGRSRVRPLSKITGRPAWPGPRSGSENPFRPRGRCGSRARFLNRSSRRAGNLSSSPSGAHDPLRVLFHRFERFVVECH